MKGVLRPDTGDTFHCVERWILCERLNTPIVAVEALTITRQCLTLLGSRRSTMFLQQFTDNFFTAKSRLPGKQNLFVLIILGWMLTFGKNNLKLGVRSQGLSYSKYVKRLCVCSITEKNWGDDVDDWSSRLIFSLIWYLILYFTDDTWKVR